MIDTVKMADAILATGTQRSAEYRLGLIYILGVRYRKSRGEKLAAITHPCPYAAGTAQADAYWSGCERGHFEWNRYQESLRSNGAAG